MKTPKQHTPSYIDESSLGVSMDDLPDRDPRLDPLPGDVLRKITKGEVRIVVKVKTRKDGKVWAVEAKCTAISRIFPWSAYPNIDQWRRWARTAEVITVAQDAPQ